MYSIAQVITLENLTDLVLNLQKSASTINKFQCNNKLLSLFTREGLVQFFQVDRQSDAAKNDKTF